VGIGKKQAKTSKPYRRLCEKISGRGVKVFCKTGSDKIDQQLGLIIVGFS
jgi:hypothetical protein